MSALIPVDTIQEYRENTPNVMGLRLQELEVTRYWGLIFSLKGIPTLTKQDVTGFLSYRQNHRWREISRDDVTVDMDKLRSSLLILIDETRPIAERLNELEPGRGAHAIAHLGKAKMTPMLLVTQPTLYGVWNDYSERALRGMGLLPDFSSGQLLGEQYEQVNQTLVELATTYRLSLWWLDVILERLARLVR
jgi:hypothetical protein